MTGDQDSNLSPDKIRERADRPQTLVCFSNEEALIVATAIEIADADSIAHIESETISPGENWCDLSRVGDDPENTVALNEQIKASIAKSVAYLEGRGLLERHPSQPWVRVREGSE